MPSEDSRHYTSELQRAIDGDKQTIPRHNKCETYWESSTRGTSYNSICSERRGSDEEVSINHVVEQRKLGARKVSNCGRAHFARDLRR